MNLFMVPFNNVSWLVCLTKEYTRNDGVWLPRLCYERKCHLISLSFRPLALEEASGHVIKILKQPYGEVLLGKNWSLLSTVSIKLSVIRVNHLGHGSSNPNQTFRWRSPGQHLECNLRDPEPEPSAKLFLDFLTHRKLWDDIFIIILSWYTLEEFVIKKQMTKIFINHILLITEFLLILFFNYFLSIAHLLYRHYYCSNFRPLSFLY